MAPGSRLGGMVLMLSLLAAPARSSAREVACPGTPDTNAFRTDRLSACQIRLWKAICSIVHAADRHGRPLYPTLFGLWQAVERSGHQVFVELITDPERCSNVAGEFTFERIDPAGRSHTLKLRLFIHTINRIYADEQPSREGMEFVPFSGLARKERYAKVLGHELAHLERMFRDPDYERLLREICAEQNSIAAEVRKGFRTPGSEAALKEWFSRIWPRVLESERPALASEWEVYRELLRK